MASYMYIVKTSTVQHFEAIYDKIHIDCLVKPLMFINFALRNKALFQSVGCVDHGTFTVNFVS